MGMISAYVLALCIAAPAADVQVKLLRGKDVQGELVAATADKLTFSTADGERTLSATELRSVEFPNEPDPEKPSVWIELIDGSRISATGISLATGKASIQLVGNEKLPEMPGRAIRAVRFNDDAKLTPAWNEILAGKRGGDVLVLRKMSTRDVEEGGNTKTVTVQSLDELEGTVLAVGPESVKFDFDGDKVDVKREKLEGIIFFQPVKRDLPPPALRLKDIADSEWLLRTFELKDDQLTGTTPAGVPMRLSLAQVKRLDFSAGNEALLAELPIENSTSSVALLPRSLSPAALEWFTPAAGKRPGGEKQPAAETTVSLTGTSSVTYRVPEGFRQFRAEAVLASKAAGNDLEIVVLGDGKPLVQHQFVAAGERKPLPIEVNVTGVRRLTLQVSSPAQGLGALVDFQEARFTK